MIKGLILTLAAVLVASTGHADGWDHNHGHHGGPGNPGGVWVEPGNNGWNGDGGWVDNGPGHGPHHPPMQQDVQLIAKTRLTQQGDMDMMQVSSCDSAWGERYSDLMIRVRREPAVIRRLEVKYGNGEIDRLPIGGLYEEGSRSEWVSLSGGARCIRAIRVMGRTVSSSGFNDGIVIGFGAANPDFNVHFGPGPNYGEQAVVEIYGMSAMPQPMPMPMPPHGGPHGHGHDGVVIGFEIGN